MIYPVALDLRGTSCLVAGGGNIALRKINRLLKSGARVRVVSPGAKAEIIKMAEKRRIRYFKRVFKPADLKGVFLVIAATDDRRTNVRICAFASVKNILANSVNSREHASFSNMAALKAGGLMVAVSSSGRKVKEAVLLRDRIKKHLSGGKK